MNVTETPLLGLKLIEPAIFGDERGFFLESYQAIRYAAHGMDAVFIQDNHSRSQRHVLRGLHYTVQRPQVQTVYVSNGCIFDVAVDLRRESPSFGRWYGVELNGQRPRMLYLPAGFAHGFCVLSDVADVHYKASHTYRADDEFGLLWNDGDIGIEWPVADPVLKPRDASFPRLADLTPDCLPQVVFTP